MALGTLANGNIRCDNCGAYIKNTGSGFIGGSLDKGGLGFLTRAASAATKHFCSDKCKREWNEAHGKGSGGGGNSGGGGSSGGGSSGEDAKVARIQAKAAEEAAMQARAAERSARNAEEKKAFFENVNGMKFDGSATEIAGELSTLVSLYAQTDEHDHDGKRKAVIEKMEFGVLRLQQSDPAQAAFFQKKLDDMHTEAEKKKLKGKQSNVTMAGYAAGAGLGFILPLVLKGVHVLPWSWLKTILLSIVPLPLVGMGIGALIGLIVSKITVKK